MKNLKPKKVFEFARKFLRDERGQSTTEYILILSIVVMVAMKFKGAFVNKIDGLAGGVVGKIDNVITQDP